MRSNRAQPVSPIMKPRRTARPAAPATPGAARQRVPRNPVALGLATRRASGAAGRHGPDRGGLRATERAALRRLLREFKCD